MATLNTTTADAIPTNDTTVNESATKVKPSTPTKPTTARRGGWSYKVGAVAAAWTGLLALGIGTGGSQILLVIVGLLLLSVAVTALTFGGGK
ncbi:hypothetical protein FB566_2368 [Stackebrandtia endophytica]|uniref:Uncharacterized protein n=1 Tax=Stackebrandtia endophytica TaxID=1496996 RepID=A0A543AW59_9ACTN|nr:hypothetical protein [Stackebrandtia endophytica]TQL76828.1 hypothetical protein FB566_2368 [Stackebrandtia endophytica]